MSGSNDEAGGRRREREPSAFVCWAGAICIAFAALTALVPALDGLGETNWSRDGTGLTLDEIFNIEAGVHLWRSLLVEGPAYFTPAGAERVAADPRFNPDHPPVGRLLIGCVHDLMLRAASLKPAPERPYSVVSARITSAVLFAVTAALVGIYAGRWYGALAGVTAATALLLSPRVFGHAHLAALETPIGLLFTWTVFYVANRWSGVRADGAMRDSARSPTLMGAGCSRSLPAWRHVVLAGVLLGLALLTKIQAVLLPIPVGIWALWRWRWRAAPSLFAFGFIGTVVFFAGWPWLWLDPVEHTLQYLGRGMNRPTLYCYYLGERFADVDVRWHYPFVMFLVTAPVGLHALGFWGVVGRTCDDGEKRLSLDLRGILVAGVILFVLTFFALPGITVYDGARLFLVVFPLWAVLVGRGGALLFQAVARRVHTAAAVVLALLVAAEGVFEIVRVHPCYLSAYSLAIGGLQGANRMGFEPTYWRDSFTREFLEEVADAVPPGTTLYVAPVLHPANRMDLALLSPILQSHALRLDSYDDKDPGKQDARYVLVFRRHADPWASLEPAPEGAALLAEVRRCGVQLAACYDLRPE